MKEINVHIGEVKVARQGETLKALLGSCVGIGLIWRAQKICGLAHCLLPVNPAPSFAIGGRFVTQAIPSLLALMKVDAKSYGEIEAVVTGGGSMTPGHDRPDHKHELVGKANLEVAKAELEKLGIKIIRFEGGGNEGRKVSLNTTDFTILIENIPRIAS